MKIKLLSLLCALLLLVGALPAASALDGEALRSANTLAALNLVDSAGAAVDYNQNAPASRADAVLLLVRLAGAEKAAKAAGGSTVFRDVPTSYAPYVAYAVRQGWVCGVSAVEFAPSRAITANAWCAMLLRQGGKRLRRMVSGDRQDGGAGDSRGAPQGCDPGLGPLVQVL